MQHLTDGGLLALRLTKRAGLRACRQAGLFRVARRITAGALRILCYHGVDGGPFPSVHPGLFMDPSTFEARLALIARHGYPVLPLERALELQAAGELPPCATVITFDDGFHGLAEHALPALARYGFPATIYVTSYYSVHQNPVFRLAIRHLLARTARAELTLDGIDGGLGDLGLTGHVDLTDPEARLALARRLTAAGEEHLDEPGRRTLAERLGERAGVDYETLAGSRGLNLLTADQLREIAATGVDIQLHTHRHRLPLSREGAAREIAENRAALASAVAAPLHHLCYPSGAWSPEHWPWLEPAGIRSATTCDPGLNWAETPRLALRRFLDSSGCAEIELEAELSGFSELVRRQGIGRFLPLPKPNAGTFSGFAAMPAAEDVMATATMMMQRIA